MDLPTVKGVSIEGPKENPRFESVERLISYTSCLGVLSRDSCKFIVSENGSVRCVANRFIPANKHILHVPFKLDLSYSTLKTEVHPDKGWAGWADIKSRIKEFEDSFQWNPYNYEQKDYFSKNLVFAVCILGILHKLRTQPDIGKHSFIVQTFDYYWKALPNDIGNVLYSWNQAELSCLQGSSFSSCLSDAKRLGEEMFEKVVLPFTESHPTVFGNQITLQDYLHINSIILTRSFGSGKKDKSSLLPIIDFVNGKPNDMHNCTLENCAIQKEINGEFIKFRVLESSCDIHSGEEIFLEYAQVGNGDYLMTYNHIPLDPEVIMNNQKTDICLDLAEFLETELLRMHPNSPNVRQMKRDHIYGFFNLPKAMPVSMEDLFSTEYSCIPSIRQVLIFLQFDETDAAKAIKTSRIKSQLNPHQLHYLFHLFLKFIECSIQKPNITLFRSLVSKQLPPNFLQSTALTFGNGYTNTVTTNSTPIPLTSNMCSAIFLQMSERLVVEVMINRFINLFPDTFHELGYSIMREHLVSTEINSILETLCRPLINERLHICLMCGSTQNVSKCSRCRGAFYCSAACQKEHWPFHRPVCKPAHNSKEIASK